jgi:hypothetical protein
LTLNWNDPDPAVKPLAEAFAWAVYVPELADLDIL